MTNITKCSIDDTKCSHSYIFESKELDLIVAIKCASTAHDAAVQLKYCYPDDFDLFEITGTVDKTIY